MLRWSNHNRVNLQIERLQYMLILWSFNLRRLDISKLLRKAFETRTFKATLQYLPRDFRYTSEVFFSFRRADGLVVSVFRPPDARQIGEQLSSVVNRTARTAHTLVRYRADYLIGSCGAVLV